MDINEQLKETELLLMKCQQQRDELLEALEFYADERNHEGDVDPDYQWTGQPKYYPSEVSADEGAIARAAIRKARAASGARKAPVCVWIARLRKHTGRGTTSRNGKMPGMTDGRVSILIDTGLTGIRLWCYHRLQDPVSITGRSTGWGGGVDITQ